MAFTINVKTALIFVVTVPLLALVIYGIMIVTIPLYKKVQKALDQVLVSTRENLAGNPCDPCVLYTEERAGRV